jgi:hypothetical protein
MRCIWPPIHCHLRIFEAAVKTIASGIVKNETVARCAASRRAKIAGAHRESLCAACKAA